MGPIRTVGRRRSPTRRRTALRFWDPVLVHVGEVIFGDLHPVENFPDRHGADLGLGDIAVHVPGEELHDDRFSVHCGQERVDVQPGTTRHLLDDDRLVQGESKLTGLLPRPHHPEADRDRATRAAIAQSGGAFDAAAMTELWDTAPAAPGS